jgi:hypothetical protein
MFSRNDSLFIATTDSHGVLQALSQALVARGMAQPQVNASGLATRGSPIGNGVTPTVMVQLFPAQGGMQVNAVVKAELDNMVVLVLCLIFLWPLALYFGYMAHQSFTWAANDLTGAMRHALTPYFQQGAAAPQGPAPGAPF